MPGSPGGKEVGRLSLKVLPDTSEFTAELKAFAARVENSIKIEIPVTIDETQAKAELKLLQAQIDAANLNVNVDVDASLALQRFDLLLASMQATADAHNIHVDVEVDTKGLGGELAKIQATTDGVGGSAGGASSQFGRWGVLIGLVLVAVAAFGPALAVVFPLIAGIGAGIGVILLGLNQLKTTFAPLVKGFGDMRKAIGGALTSGLAPFVSKFVSAFLPALKTGLVQFATFMNGALKGLLSFLSSASGISLIGQLFTGLSTAMKPFGALLPLFVKVFLQLSIAALPALQMMGDALVRVTTAFSTFLSKGTASPAITKSMADLGRTLAVLGKLGADLFPVISAAIAPTLALLTGFGSTLGALLSHLTPVFKFLDKHTTVMAAIGSALAVLVVGFGALSAAVAVFDAVVAANPIGLIVIALVALAAGLTYAYKHSETFRNIVNKSFAAVKAVVGPVVDFIVAHWKIFAAIILLPVLPLIALGALIVKNFGTIKAVVGPVIDFIVAHWKIFAAIILLPLAPIALLVAFIISHFTQIKTFITTVFTVIKAVVTVVWAGIQAIVQAAVSAVMVYVRGLMAVGSIVAGAFGAARSVASAAWGAIRAVVSGAVRGVMAVVRGISVVAGIFRTAFNAAKSAVSSASSAIVGVAKSLVGKIKSALSFDLSGAGRKLMNSFGAGITSAANAVYNKVKALASKIKGLLPGSPIKYGPLLGWNRGGVGKLLMGMLEHGIRVGGVGVISQAQTVSRGIQDALAPVDLAAQFASVNGMAGLNTSMTAQIGAIVDNTAGPQPQEIILNWDTGRGVMKDITDQSMASKEFVARTNNLLGVS